jgi:hypothetical protein
MSDASDAKNKSTTLDAVERKLVTKPATHDAIAAGVQKRKGAGLAADVPTELVKPLDRREVAACACVCSYVCTCYAMPESHAEVVLDPAVIGRRVLDGDNLDLGVLHKK